MTGTEGDGTGQAEDKVLYLDLLHYIRTGG